MPEFHPMTIAVSQMIFDPNNYRFQDEEDYQVAANNRFHIDGVQNRIFRKLRDDGLFELKNSIQKNGFLPVEPLVVRSYEHKEDTYLVIEGNRRLAALKWIQADVTEGGVEVPERVVNMLDQIPVIVVSHEEDDPAFYEALMGVRHVSGIKQWGAYQRSKLVTVLRDTRGLSSSEIADRLGMQTAEVNRRYKAFKALQQMQEDENFGSLATLHMYALFFEAVSSPAIRQWLEWDDTQSRFTSEERTIFYDLITENDRDDVGFKEAKLRTTDDIRELQHVLRNSEAKDILLDRRRPYIDAVTVAKQEQISRSWITKIRASINALENISYVELTGLSSEQVSMLNRLNELTYSIVSAHTRLSESS